ncbi:D-serine ammonia-lyase [Natribacillus halophilus]|uniref:Probable D-serine dehydratase n=1 Tax=Natribacillus halophilus TaxID=549003 RepID=A0A1G8J3F5_9BACI|nr:D-serine ammonia-lyase [Natribacillus halophilus]SDI25785.1 D-serine ammonia-lyase [Natribacillus halophilus]
MSTQNIHGRTLEEWMNLHPALARIVKAKEVVWLNPKYQSLTENAGQRPFSLEDINKAAARLRRFQPLIAELFPETTADDGLIESSIIQVPNMQSALSQTYNTEMPGKLWLKADHDLPIAGSIKARGGVYEVLKFAEQLAGENGMLNGNMDYRRLASADARRLFSQYGVAVGSTGNLGLSIGIMGAKLGFRAEVHMSSDAKEWKKEKLRSVGATVVEYDEDFSQAVAEGRKAAEEDPHVHFVDDEWSRDLFMGYAVSALRIKRQLERAHIQVDREHPLLVYLPCGVGGGPGGVTFGLKQVFGDAVHCFFVEPTESPAMFLGLLTGMHEKVAVDDFGLSNRTAADGLAVGRPSGMVGKIIETMVSGVYTVDDGHLYQLLQQLWDTESIYLEPSALAGFPGPFNLLGTAAGQTYCEHQGIDERTLQKATHLLWGTGGSMVPDDVKRADYEMAKPK